MTTPFHNLTNTALADDPALVNSAPTGDGWFFRIKIAESAALDALMDEAAYATYVEGLSEE